MFFNTSFLPTIGIIRSLPLFFYKSLVDTLVPQVFFSLGATELSRDCESRSDEKKTSGTNG